MIPILLNVMLKGNRPGRLLDQFDRVGITQGRLGVCQHCFSSSSLAFLVLLCQWYKSPTGFIYRVFSWVQGKKGEKNSLYWDIDRILSYSSTKQWSLSRCVAESDPWLVGNSTRSILSLYLGCCNRGGWEGWGDSKWLIKSFRNYGKLKTKLHARIIMILILCLRILEPENV